MGVKIPVEGTGWGQALSSAAIAGVYDVLDHAPKRPEIVNIPSWTNVGFNDGSAYFDGRTGKIEEFFQKLNMKDSYAQIRIRWNNKGKVTDLNITIFVCRDKPHIGVVKYSITPHWSGTAHFTSTIDGSGVNQYEEQDKGFDIRKKLIWLNVETTGSEIGIAQYAAMEFSDNVTVLKSATCTLTDKKIGLSLEFNVQKGETYTCYKFVSAYTSLDTKEPLAEAKSTALNARKTGYEKLFKEHRDAWHELWQTDIIVEGNDELQRFLRSSLFYLLGSVRKNISRGIPGAGLSETRLNWQPILMPESYSGIWIHLCSRLYYFFTRN